MTPATPTPAPTPGTDAVALGITTGEPESSWAWVQAPYSVLRSSPSADARAGAALPRGTRVAVRARNGAQWAFVVAGRMQGWTDSADLATERLSAPAPASAAKTVHAAASKESRAPRIDARALDESAAGAAAPSKRDPADDLATLQVAVDEMYLDPVTWRPSPARRKKDADEFRRGIE